jgi:hypothetical protein
LALSPPGKKALRLELEALVCMHLIDAQRDTISKVEPGQQEQW